MLTRPRVRVVLADDNYLVREGLAALIRESGGLELVGAAADSRELLALVDAEGPDVVITDIRMPPTHTTEGIAAAHEIRRRYPNIGVVVLSQHLDSRYVTDLLAHGAAGIAYLLKERMSDLDQLVQAATTVSQGGSLLDPQVVERLLARESGPGAHGVASLNEREREVLEAMATGATNAAIASRVFVSERAVEKAITSIFLKLGLTEETEIHRRVMAVLTYLDAKGG